MITIKSTRYNDQELLELYHMFSEAYIDIYCEVKCNTCDKKRLCDDMGLVLKYLSNEIEKRDLHL